MNRKQHCAMGILLALVCAAGAQQSAPAPLDKAAHPVAANLALLTAKLDLTADQQEKVRPILQELHQAMVKLAHDEGISPDERMGKMRDSFYRTDHELRPILNDEQKAKLDQIEHEPHSDLHHQLSEGALPPAQ